MDEMQLMTYLFSGMLAEAGGEKQEAYRAIRDKIALLTTKETGNSLADIAIAIAGLEAISRLTKE